MHRATWGLGKRIGPYSEAISANTIGQLIEIPACSQGVDAAGPQFGPQTQPIWRALPTAHA